ALTDFSNGYLGGDSAPVANNDNYTTPQNTQLVVPAPGVLGNDVDPDNNPMLASKVTDPAHGTLTLNADGGFTYTPTTGYVGGDSFTYKAYDGKAYSNTDATVTINIAAAPNTPPTAYPDSYDVVQNTTLYISNPGVLANDTDPDTAQTLTAT